VEFPERLATLRREHGLTQVALAERIGVHVSQLRRYEAGTAEPTLGVLGRMAVALSVTTDALILGSEPQLPDNLGIQRAFEATAFLDDEERAVVSALLEAFLDRHDQRRGQVGPRAARPRLHSG